MISRQRYAVIGDPIAHSRSPAMHAAAYRELGLPHTYEAVRVSAEELPIVMDQIRRGDWDGINVTVPHKLRALELADVVDDLARLAGAANTLVRLRDGQIAAFNTDVPALAAELDALRPGAGPQAGRGLVLGAGGAARAAILALATLGVEQIAVRARDAAKAAALAREMTGARGLSPVVAEPFAADPAREKDIRYVVQATSAGMSGADPGDAVARAVAWDALPDDAAVVETIYAPPETPLLAAARARGLAAANGAGMLARQGALAFQLWLGVPAPLDAMRAALVRT